MKSNALLSGVFFGLFMAICMITILSIETDGISLKIIVSGIIGSFIGGLVFGLFMKFISNKRK